ncbi:exopolysaccharide transport family protein [Sphingosinicella sp. BN140058]|uniref:GumC family protein n=1 Tax=Sphingosinicella sp. BN140058 TaxID=1892855 RepID=UPI0013EC1D82|nr:exopolysaccharide transport family protein [Sphingosinicella sp. BN140058]
MNVQARLLGPTAPSDGGGAAPRSMTSPVHANQLLSIRQMWSIIRRRKILLFLVVALVTGAVTISQLLTPRLYEAVATTQVELNDATGANQADVAARNQQRVANEARLYRSRALAEKVVRDLDLIHDPRFMLQADNGDPDRAILRASARLENMTKINSTGDSDLIDIVVQSRSPELAARIANQFVDSLQELKFGRRNIRKERTAIALAGERDRLAAETQAAEQAIADFRRQHGMLAGAGGPEDYQQLNRIAVEAASASAARAAMAARTAGMPGADTLYRANAGKSALLEQQQRQYEDLMRQRSDLKVTYGARHPEMQRIDAQLAEIRGGIEREQLASARAERDRANAAAARERQLAASEAAAAAARASTLESRVGVIRSKAFSNSENLVQLAALERRAEVLKQSYIVTAQRAQDVRAELKTTGVNSSLISQATVPDQPVAPAPKKAALAAFSGSMILGLLLIFALEMFDNRIWSSEQIAQLFGLRTFAMFPKVNAATLTDADGSLVTRQPHSVYAEVARNLFAEVEHLAPENTHNSVLVTSPLPGAGKSMVAVALVAAAAAAGRRAVVVDLDFRNRNKGISPLEGDLSQGPDLMDYLVGGAQTTRLLPPPEPAESARDAPTYTPVVLASRSSADPAAFIRLTQIRRLLGDLRNDFDLVVINAPSVLSVRDARTIVGLADSTIMVVQWGKTTIEQMRAASQILQEQVDGAVINRVDYAEHAKRGHGDPLQFYAASVATYDEEKERPAWFARLRRGARRHEAA